ncbi:MAG TPA: penicillin-binding protein 2 [bacterium]|nr:penicillin-binding protein 2 [bacterium]
MANLFVIEEKSQKIKNSKLDFYNQQISGESFDFDSKQEALKVTINKTRVVIFFIFIILFLLIFIYRAFYLQILKGNYWYNVAEGNRIRIEKQVPPRGIIFDRNLKSLVNNSPDFILSFVPFDLVNNAVEIDQIVFFLQQEKIFFSADELREKIKKTDSQSIEPVEIIDQITYEQALKLMMQIENFPALRLNYINKRNYIDVRFGLAHILGYMGKMDEKSWQSMQNKDYLLIDWIGKSGLEKVYEEKLRGVVGKKEVEVDARGEIKKNISNKKLVKGNSLILGIDADFNAFLTDKLCTAANLYGAKAAALAVNPQNGEILALVSCPIYNNNYFNNTLLYQAEIENLLEDKKQPLFNRAVQGEYPAGSIFKLVMAAAGLQEKIITEDTKINSTGGISIGQWFFPDWKAGGHGLTNITKAIAESVNTFFYYVGGGFGDEFSGLGLERIVSYANKFYFNHVLGIDLPGEADGFLPSQEWKKKNTGENWYIGDTYHLSIGQGDLTVTPLQILSLTSYFANGGTLYQPHLLKGLIDDKNITTYIEPKILAKNIVDNFNVELVRQGMRQAVLSGSASSLQDLPVTSAAKTGTAQAGDNQQPHAWFTVFAPFEKPEIVITVLIENGVEGSLTALPVVKDALSWYFTRPK